MAREFEVQRNSTRLFSRVAELSSLFFQFIIEGIATVCISIVAVFVLPDFPHSTKFLTPDERALAIMRLVTADTNTKQLSHWEAFKAAVSDYHTWLLTLAYVSFFGSFPLGAIQLLTLVSSRSFFFLFASTDGNHLRRNDQLLLPYPHGFSRIQGSQRVSSEFQSSRSSPVRARRREGLTFFLPSSLSHSNYMTAPIYMGCLVICILVGFSSDHFKEKPFHLAGCAVVSGVSFIVVSQTSSNHAVQYAFILFGGAGIWSATPLFLR